MGKGRVIEALASVIIPMALLLGGFGVTTVFARHEARSVQPPSQTAIDSLVKAEASTRTGGCFGPRHWPLWVDVDASSDLDAQATQQTLNAMYRVGLVTRRMVTPDTQATHSQYPNAQYGYSLVSKAAPYIHAEPEGAQTVCLGRLRVEGKAAPVLTGSFDVPAVKLGDTNYSILRFRLVPDMPLKAWANAIRAQVQEGSANATFDETSYEALAQELGYKSSDEELVVASKSGSEWGPVVPEEGNQVFGPKEHTGR